MISGGEIRTNRTHNNWIIWKRSLKGAYNRRNDLGRILGKGLIGTMDILSLEIKSSLGIVSIHFKITTCHNNHLYYLPLYPTTSTFISACVAKETAWLHILGLLPISPSTRTTADISTRRCMKENKILFFLGLY